MTGTEALARQGGRRRQGAAAEGRPPRGSRLPLTAMIDVTFQLLLFFILACDIRETEGRIPGTLPAGTVVGPYDELLPKPIRIRLRPSADHLAANYEVSDHAGVLASEEELYNCLRGRQQGLGGGGTKVPVVIEPKPGVAWEFVVRAFNQAVRARFERIGFARDLL